MPEGPELRLNSLLVSRVCEGRVFTGGVAKSAVSKCCDVPFTSPRYTITSEARGKEMALILQCLERAENRLRILFRFGMSGRFRFGPVSEVPKHTHLQFFTDEQPQNVLCFVDVRRFGSWHLMEEGWGEERGPDPMYEYEEFRKNILENLEDSAFNRPICEAMLNQKYFNGVGNYLRAEILYRVGVAPFTCARKVLETLGSEESFEWKKKRESTPDLIQLCHDVPLEVVQLKVGLGKSSESAVTTEDYRVFINEWLRCYENPEMSNLKDHNGRTIWFKGEAGPMAPKHQKSRAPRRRKPTGMVKKEDISEEEPVTQEKDTKSQLLKRKRSRSGVTEDEDNCPPKKKRKGGGPQKRPEEMLSLGTPLRRSNRVKAMKRGSRST